MNILNLSKIEKIFKIIGFSYDLREIIAEVKSLRPNQKRSKVLKIIYEIIFNSLVVLYYLKLEKLKIDHTKNIFITMKYSRIQKILKLNQNAQNILFLSEERLRRNGDKFKAIRGNLNKADGLYVKELSYDHIFKDLHSVMMNSSKKWTLSSEFYDIEKLNIIGLSVLDSYGNLLATTSGFFSQDFFNIEYLIHTTDDNALIARWVLHEAIVDKCKIRCCKYIRISNSLDTSRKNLYFNRRLGYKDYNLI